MEISFCELRAKEVVNVFNGQKLGNIIDMIIDTACARVLGIVVPNCKSGFNLFRSNAELFIPYHRIVKIGKDIILVDLNNITTQSTNNSPNKKSDKSSKYSVDQNSTNTLNNQPTNNQYYNNQNSQPNTQYIDNEPYNGSIYSTDNYPYNSINNTYNNRYSNKYADNSQYDY